MPIVTFKPVELFGTRVIITGYGQSGCGKTHSLLLIARGLVGPEGRVGMIDTENGRGRLFAKIIPGGYEYAELTPPFSSERCAQAVRDAERAGIQALVVDSGSHEWNSYGGVLDLADAQKNAKGEPARGQAKWLVPKARHKKYVQALLATQMHLLISLRAKDKSVTLPRKVYTPNGWVEEKIPEGMNRGDIVSEGLAAIQDASFIFETTIQLLFADGNNPGVPYLHWPQFKCPSDLKGAFREGEQITENTGRMIAEWVAGGTPVDRQYEELKRRAEDAAAIGTEEYRKWWTSVGREVRDRLADIHDNNKSIAAEADKRLSDTVTGIAADAAGASDAESLEMRLAAATTMAAIDGIEDEWRAPMSEMSHEGWLECQAKIDARKVEVQQS